MTNKQISTIPLHPRGYDLRRLSIVDGTADWEAQVNAMIGTLAILHPESLNEALADDLMPEEGSQAGGYWWDTDGPQRFIREVLAPALTREAPEGFTFTRHLQHGVWGFWPISKAQGEYAK